MPILTITQNYASLQPLTKAELDAICSSITTFVNTTKLDYLNINSDSVGSNMTSTGANAVGVAMTSAGANAVLASSTAWTPNSTQADAVGTAMTSTGAHAIEANLGTSASFTATLTGCASTVTGTVYATKIGKLVNLSFPSMSGTSNSNACTITGIPSAYWPSTVTQTILIRIINGPGATNLGLFQIDSAGNATILADAGGGTWTSSGTKGLLGNSITYSVAN